MPLSRYLSLRRKTGNEAHTSLPKISSSSTSALDTLWESDPKEVKPTRLSASFTGRRFSISNEKIRWSSTLSKLWSTRWRLSRKGEKDERNDDEATEKLEVSPSEDGVGERLRPSLRMSHIFPEKQHDLHLEKRFMSQENEKTQKPLDLAEDTSNSTLITIVQIHEKLRDIPVSLSNYDKNAPSTNESILPTPADPEVLHLFKVIEESKPDDV
jgi:hypothetical protein